MHRYACFDRELALPSNRPVLVKIGEQSRGDIMKLMEGLHPVAAMAATTEI